MGLGFGFFILIMSKDPAVLLYTSDFLSGTMTMTDEHVGMYIRLLCLQHQKGFLTEKDMLYICKTYVEDVYCKFVVEDGKYYNIRMREEGDKRKKYSESRKNNILKRYESKETTTYVEHMENENENTNKDIVLNKSKPEKVEVVIEYGNEIGLTLTDSESFFDYYTANGWKVGKNSMKDWKSALRNWKRNKDKYKGATNGANYSGNKQNSAVARATYEKSPDQIQQDVRNTAESIRLLRRERG